jgi:hypothetical protein
MMLREMSYSASQKSLDVEQNTKAELSTMSRSDERNDLSRTNTTTYKIKMPFSNIIKNSLQ